MKKTLFTAVIVAISFATYAQNIVGKDSLLSIPHCFITVIDTPNNQFTSTLNPNGVPYMISCTVNDNLYDKGVISTVIYSMLGNAVRSFDYTIDSTTYSVKYVDNKYPYQLVQKVLASQRTYITWKQ